MEFPKPGFNLREAIDQINAGDDLSRLPDEKRRPAEVEQLVGCTYIIYRGLKVPNLKKTGAERNPAF